MFKHLCVGPRRVLPKVELLDLGKVNVTCGRNSSGKSTLLESIASKETRGVGHEHGDIVPKIADPCLEAVAFNRPDVPKGHPWFAEFRAMTTNVAAAHRPGKPYFLESAGELLQKLRQA